MENECMSGGHAVTSANDSREHIVSNAMGGRKKTKGFLCEPCNNTTGSAWDAELARQLNALCHFFEIARERGEPPAETVTTTAGETLQLIAGGKLGLDKPSHKTEPVAGGTKIQLVARTLKEARKMLKGFKRKHPKLDIQTTLTQAEPGETYPEGMIHIPVKIGGPLAGRSIIKTAAAFAHECGIGIARCEVAAACLRNPESQLCFGYFNSRDLVIDRPKGVPFHCVAIEGDPTTGLLLGYVEFFGFLRMVVLLSEKYEGVSVSNCYAIDPRTATTLNVQVRLGFSRADIADIFDYKHADHQAFGQAAGEVIGPAQQRKAEAERQRVTQAATEYAFANCGAKEGEMFSEEHRANILRLMLDKLRPYIMNVVRPRPAPPEVTPGSNTGGGSAS